jgi:ribosomal protein L32
MSFAPRKKTSKSRSRKRTSNWINLTAKKLENRVVLNAQKNGLAHFIATDGTYKGKKVLKIKTKAKATTRI